MTMNEKDEGENRSVQLQILGGNLEKVDTYKNLGLEIDNKGLEKERYKLRKKSEKMYGIISGKINFRANKYEVMRRLWKGLEITDVGGKEKKKDGNSQK